MLLAEFMMIFFGIKPNSTYKFDKSILYKAGSTLECLRKYSYEKFTSLQDFRELRIMIVKMYNHDLEELFSKERVMGANRERYIEAIEEFIDKA